MKRMSPPDPEVLRTEIYDTPDGRYEACAVQFGCNGCTYGHRAVLNWLSRDKLVEMLDSEEGVPRAFVIGKLGGIGAAQTCEVSETGEILCVHEEALSTVIQRSSPFPE